MATTNKAATATTTTTSTTTNNNRWIIQKSIELFKSFNPVTHSIDTHLLEHLGDVTQLNSSSDHVFIQQVVYGCHREQRMLDAFVRNFYADNAASLLRVDVILYTIFAYLSIYRLDELGFSTFQEFTASQDPTKMYLFVTYLFNKENLWSSLRAEWMKVADLSFVEDEIIASVERFIPQANSFCKDLQIKAVGVAAAQAAKDAEQKAGTVGLAKVNKKPPTVPKSPRLSKLRVPTIPEPEAISTNFVAHEVPDFLDFTNLETLNKQNAERRQGWREKNMAKYNDPKTAQQVPIFQELKGGRDIDEVRREVEEDRMKGIDFNASFVHPAPDFSKIPAKVRLNAAAIYREDSLFRKQQAKDAKTLKQYEEELRDRTEFLLWQKEMRQKDKAAQMEQIAQRKEAIKMSHIECADAMAKQKEDNRVAAEMLRKEVENMKLQKDLEQEKAILRNQEVVQNVTEARELKPKVALDRLLEERAERARLVREELEVKRLEQERLRAAEEEGRADRIRQLRAENEVHRKQVNVFDPTEIKGSGFLDEMSYMEMKIRLADEKARVEREEMNRRQRILDDKDKRARDLEERARTLTKVRQTKAETNQAYYQQRRENEKREKELAEKARQEAAIKLEEELREKREEKRRVAAALHAEEERVLRQQQYLGAAAGKVEETREEDLLKARERVCSVAQKGAKEESVLIAQTRAQDRQNRQDHLHKAALARQAADLQKEKTVLEEKKRAVRALREEVLAKRAMALNGKEQHKRTETVLKEHNPYVAKMNEESVQKARIEYGSVR